MIDVPDGWTLEPFSEVATFKAGRTPARANSAYWTGSGSRYPWVAIADMSDYGTVTNPKETITQAAFDDVFRGELSPAGTLIMSFKLTIGRVAVLGVPAAHNEAIISIQPRADIDQRYLGYYLSHFDYQELQDRAIKGQTLNRDKINRISVLLPPNGDMARIADVLDFVRDCIRLQQRALEVAKALKAAVAKKLFSAGLRGEAQVDSELGAIPAGWTVTALGDIGKIGSGTTPNRRDASLWNGGTTPWITSGRMHERRISGSDTHVTDAALARYSLPVLQRGAVLIAIVGQGRTLGHCALLDVPATISRHVGFVQPDSTLLSPLYLRAYLESQYEYLRQLAAGNGSTRAALTAAMLRPLKIPLPPSLDEQEEIARVLDTIDQSIHLHQRKESIFEDLFKSILHKLMTAEISVNDLDLSALPTSEEALA